MVKASPGRESGETMQFGFVHKSCICSTFSLGSAVLIQTADSSFIRYMNRCTYDLARSEPYYENELVVELGYSFKTAVWWDRTIFKTVLTLLQINGGTPEPFLHIPGRPLGYRFCTNWPTPYCTNSRGPSTYVLDCPGPNKYSEQYSTRGTHLPYLELI